MWGAARQRNFRLANALVEPLGRSAGSRLALQNFPEMDRKVSFSVVSRSRPTSMRTMLQSTS